MLPVLNANMSHDGERHPDDLGPEEKGLVISHFGQQLDIEALEGEYAGEIFRCHQRSNLEPLVTGDHVIWRRGEPTGVVIANLQRSSFCKRPIILGAETRRRQH